MTGAIEKIRLTLGMIKFPHSVFALPFALIAYFWAEKGGFNLRTFLLIILAMVSARSVAMTVNRIADLKFDIKNPRTRMWPLAKGELSIGFAGAFLVVNLVVFEVSAWMLNSLCFYLSPVALLFLIGYSYTKRFTWLCHLVLGFTDGIAPVGAWIAVTGKIEPPALWLCAAVTFWIAGFDILYSLQDRDFDEKEGLFSIPVRFGVKAGLVVSALFHAVTYGAYIMAGIAVGAGVFYWFGLGIILPLLVYEHMIIKPDDLSRMNAAFFTLNGYVSIVILAFALIDIYKGKL